MCLLLCLIQPLNFTSYLFILKMVKFAEYCKEQRTMGKYQYTFHLNGFPTCYYPATLCVYTYLHLVVVRLLSCVWLFATSWTVAYPLLSPRVCSSSWLLIRWCYLTISSSVTPFSSCPQSFPASESFPVSQLSHQVAKVLELQQQTFQWIFRVDFL